jgi:microcystin-dependent protein
MVSTFTPNIQLEEPARGDDVGTWDTPVNNNMTLVDLVAGGTATINLSGGNVTLSAVQFQGENITFNSTLLSNTTVTFPTSFKKPYAIGNFCTGSSAFNVILQTTAAGGEKIGVPFGTIVDVVNDGTNIRFKNLPAVGSYLDTVNALTYLSVCTIPPWLNCDGSTFPSSTYPTLFQSLGGSNTLPDSRGRFRAVLNQGTGRLATANGLNGDATLAAGGADSITLNTSQIPSHTHSNTLTDSGHVHSLDVHFGGSPGGNFASAIQSGGANTTVTNSTVTGISINNAAQGGGGSHSNVPPAYVGGYTYIRAG